MEIFDLKANKRETKGKGPARALRTEGMIPAVLYGPGKEPVSLSIDISELELILKKSKSSQHIVNLTIAGEEKPAISVMMKELQTHPLSRSLLHADFYEVDMAKKIKVKVPVETTGKSIGVEVGGIMQIVRRNLEVFCLPLEIPRSIIIDINDLDIGDSVHVKELNIEGDVEIIADNDFTVVTVVAPKQEVEEEVEVEDGEEGEEGEEGAEGEDGEAKEGGKEETPEKDDKK